MDLVTFYNYPDEDKYFDMFKIWIMHAIECKKKTIKLNNIIIITNSLSKRILSFYKKINIDYIKIKYCRYSDKVDNATNVKMQHNVFFKFFNLCLLNKPYIYLDADAFILSDLNEAIECSYDKPFICVNHQTIPGHTSQYDFKFLNTGFTIVSDPKFFNFETVLNTPINYTCPGTDQMLVFNYCKTIGYDYTHIKIHYGYNSCSAFKTIKNNVLISDGIKEKHNIYVLHYWFHYKPWTLCKCCVRGNEVCPLYNKWLTDIKEYFPY